MSYNVYHKLKLLAVKKPWLLALHNGDTPDDYHMTI